MSKYCQFERKTPMSTKNEYIDFSGNRAPLKICSLTTAKVPAISLFENLTPDCKPVTTKSRRHTEADQSFIAMK
ncbi:hypothetical protein JTE90_009858 [Oedothorax gibbosus]|uniref:Uncharacterized protein n=1 Tax=Oedothorax gibbosus TaxID=931172 RepID=A0AAV6TPH5_9ARAC|nr:hypothetical protein JTE90_009858 [Oedothorax gibbosus]